MNLPSAGGFIDGEDLDEELLASPAAVGQLVNHPSSGQEPNVCVVDFRWSDCFRWLHGEVAGAGHDAADGGSGAGEAGAGGEGGFYPIPNQARCDDPWYVCPTSLDIRHFPPRRRVEPRAGAREAPGGGSLPLVAGSTLAGAVIVASRRISAGEELLLDYDLKGPPYPPWAAGWYRPVR